VTATSFICLLIGTDGTSDECIRQVARIASGRCRPFGGFAVNALVAPGDPPATTHSIGNRVPVPVERELDELDRARTRRAWAPPPPEHGKRLIPDDVEHDEVERECRRKPLVHGVKNLDPIHSLSGRIRCPKVQRAAPSA